MSETLPARLTVPLFRTVRPIWNLAPQLAGPLETTTPCQPYERKRPSAAVTPPGQQRCSRHTMLLTPLPLAAAVPAPEMLFLHPPDKTPILPFKPNTVTVFPREKIHKTLSIWHSTQRTLHKCQLPLCHPPSYFPTLLDPLLPSISPPSPRFCPTYSHNAIFTPDDGG